MISANQIATSTFFFLFFFLFSFLLVCCCCFCCFFLFFFGGGGSVHVCIAVVLGLNINVVSLHYKELNRGSL